VGIAKDTQLTQIADIPTSYIYLPANSSSTGLNVLIRGGTNFASTDRAVRAIAHELDAGLVVRTNPLEDNLNYWRTMSRLATSLSASLGALALMIASVGVYGVVSYAVSRRIREMGIRLVLGATGSDLRRMILKQAMRPVVIGVLIGIAGAAAVSRILEGVLFGISALDPLAFLGAALCLIAVALAASLAPARRALRADPLTTLRYE
jgi:ABC-type antimicrobial peptide transport system permease subunit